MRVRRRRIRRSCYDPAALCTAVEVTPAPGQRGVATIATCTAVPNQASLLPYLLHCLCFMTVQQSARTPELQAPLRMVLESQAKFQSCPGSYPPSPACSAGLDIRSATFSLVDVTWYLYACSKVSFSYGSRKRSHPLSHRFACSRSITVSDALQYSSQTSLSCLTYCQWPLAQMLW